MKMDRLSWTFTKLAYIQPTAVEDPWIIVEQFRKAAKNAKEAGFDGVESRLSMVAELRVLSLCLII